MEQQVLELLRASQQPDSETRISAELQLQHLKKTDHFANALVTIGTHQEVADGDRLAALLALKAFVAEAWSPSLEEYGGKVLIDDSTKAAVKERLLSIVFNGNNHTKIVSVTAAVVSKIAKADFPEAWPNLLNTLLDHVPQSDDSQLQGILVVLADLVHDGLDEEAFSHCAHALIEALRGTAFDGNRTLMVRAQAVSAFRGCFDFVDMLKDRDERAMLIFLEPICEAWSTFACKVVSEVLPPLPGDKEQAEVGSVLGQWHGVIALKVQVVLVRMNFLGILFSPRTSLVNNAYVRRSMANSGHTDNHQDSKHFSGSIEQQRSIYCDLASTSRTWSALLCLLR